jgi:hypothetical protein
MADSHQKVRVCIDMDRTDLSEEGKSNKIGSRIEKAEGKIS